MIDIAHKLIASKQAVAQAEETLLAAKAEHDEIKAQLLKEFEEGGVQSVKCGGQTVYLHRQIWARCKPACGAALAEALVSEGLDELISQSVNTQKLSAWVRELEADETPIPSAIEQQIAVEEVFDVRIRKG